MRAMTVLDDLSPTRAEQNMNGLLSNSLNGGTGIMEGECLLMTKAERYKKHWVALMGNEVYFYKSREDQCHIFMHSLAGTFIKELP
jgi:hypothetical protein